MGKVMYCEKCGWVGGVLFGKKCGFCNTKMKILSEEMKKKYNIFTDNWSNLYSELHMLNTDAGAKKRIEELLSRKNDFIMNEVANNTLFSKEDYKNQVEKNRQGYYETVEYYSKKIGERQTKNIAKMQKEKDKINCIPKCPICGSTNVKKITIGTRAVKTAAFGVIGAMDDTGKTWKCGNCSSKF